MLSMSISTLLTLRTRNTSHDSLRQSSHATHPTHGRRYAGPQSLAQHHRCVHLSRRSVRRLRGPARRTARPGRDSGLSAASHPRQESWLEQLQSSGVWATVSVSLHAPTPVARRDDPLRQAAEEVATRPGTRTSHTVDRMHHESQTSNGLADSVCGGTQAQRSDASASGRHRLVADATKSDARQGSQAAAGAHVAPTARSLSLIHISE